MAGKNTQETEEMNKNEAVENANAANDTSDAANEASDAANEANVENEASSEASDEANVENEASSEASGEAEAENDEASEQTKEKKGFLKKKPKKDKKDEMIEELSDKYKRLFAEFDNFRKRSETEKASNYDFGAREVVLKILPVVDNFERGLATLTEEEKKSGFAEGMEMTYKQLMTALEGLGVKPIEALGKEFDPELHNAVMQTENPDFEENVVSQELQKGYTYKDKAIRHSMVAVNK